MVVSANYYEAICGRTIKSLSGLVYMKIDGRLIAHRLKAKLQVSISRLSASPHIAVVLVDNDPSSLAYIEQKVKVGKEIGAQVAVFRFPKSVSATEFFHLIEKLNKDNTVNGIIIQRPLPIDIDKEKLNTSVVPQKDVDGFHPTSIFSSPVACAVIKILQWVHQDIKNNKPVPDFTSWLKTHTILVIGRGETAGKPIANYLNKKKYQVTIAHSKTKNIKDLCLRSDIIISCVGQPNVVRHNMVTNKTILLGVGMHSENGKLKADYIQEEIANKVTYYTPVPGGVGPVNVACLFENVLEAAEASTG